MALFKSAPASTLLRLGDTHVILGQWTLSVHVCIHLYIYILWKLTGRIICISFQVSGIRVVCNQEALLEFVVNLGFSPPWFVYEWIYAMLGQIMAKFFPYYQAIFKSLELRKASSSKQKMPPKHTEIQSFFYQQIMEEVYLVEIKLYH